MFGVLLFFIAAQQEDDIDLPESVTFATDAPFVTTVSHTILSLVCACTTASDLTTVQPSVAAEDLWDDDHVKFDPQLVFFD
jgi:hypothetical protein